MSDEAVKKLEQKLAATNEVLGEINKRTAAQVKIPLKSLALPDGIQIFGGKSLLMTGADYKLEYWPGVGVRVEDHIKNREMFMGSYLYMELAVPKK